MVQIVDKPQPFESLKRGAGSLADAFAPLAKRRQEEKLLSKKTDEEIRRDKAKILEAEASKERESERFAQFLGIIPQTQKQPPSDQLLQEGPPNEPLESPPAKSFWDNLDDNRKALFAHKYPQVAKQFQAQDEAKRKTKEKEASANQSARQFEHTQSTDYAKELSHSSERAHEALDAVKEVQKRIKKQGVVGPNARNLAYQYLAGKKSKFADFFQTEDTQAIASAAKSLAGGGFRELFGSKATGNEFFWYENILPNY